MMLRRPAKVVRHNGRGPTERSRSVSTAATRPAFVTLATGSVGARQAFVAAISFGHRVVSGEADLSFGSLVRPVEQLGRASAVCVARENACGAAVAEKPFVLSFGSGKPPGA